MLTGELLMNLELKQKDFKNNINDKYRRAIQKTSKNKCKNSIL